MKKISGKAPTDPNHPLQTITWDETFLNEGLSEAQILEEEPPSTPPSGA